jgi:hypothetical protein
MIDDFSNKSANICPQVAEDPIGDDLSTGQAQ